jgi:uncharacterized protein YqiB (DUF1249 family)
MWFYEKNYRFLIKLLPDLVTMPVGEFQLHHAGHTMQIKVLESCPYTQMLELSQHFVSHAPLINDLRMKVRVYHDARLAEVTGYQGLGRLLVKYSIPNAQMLHPDEKRQANLLLHDWLTMFIVSFKKEGHTAIVS